VFDDFSKALATRGHPTDLMVGEAIRRRRLERRLTQSQLAEALGIEVRLLADYESGRKRAEAEHLRRIAATLQTAIAAFFNTQVREQ